MYKKMLVPLDGSKLGEMVFPFARELAWRLRLATIVLHVCASEKSQLSPVSQDYIEQAANTVRPQSDETGQPVEVQGKIVVGHPAEEILCCAQKNNIDLILMATHGRSGINRWVLGSVADKVLRASCVPVWLVRAGTPQGTDYDRCPR